MDSSFGPHLSAIAIADLGASQREPRAAVDGQPDPLRSNLRHALVGRCETSAIDPLETHVARPHFSAKQSFGESVLSALLSELDLAVRLVRRPA